MTTTTTTPLFGSVREAAAGELGDKFGQGLPAAMDGELHARGAGFFKTSRRRED